MLKYSLALNSTNIMHFLYDNRVNDQFAMQFGTSLYLFAAIAINSKSSSNVIYKGNI